MADDEAPYSGAIEQTAKTAGKALDLVKDAAGPIADIYGLVIGDHIGAARSRRLDKMMRKTKKILKDRDLAETAEVAEQIAIPLLEAAQREPRDEMQELWARLLANAMDPSRSGDVRPEFIDALRGFHPIDAVVLEAVKKSNNDTPMPGGLSQQINLRASSVAVSMSNLASLKCLNEFPSQHGAYFRLTPFGSELLLACSL
jgi:hypothetical protein